MTTLNQTSSADEKPADAIEQAVEILKRYSGGIRLTQVGSRDSDGAILLASVGIAIAEQLRRIADVQEVRHD